MKRKWWIQIFILIAVIVIAIITSIAHGFRTCNNLNITIDYDSASVFVTTDEVKANLISLFGNIEAQRLNEIDVQKMETTLQQNPFISKVDISTDISGDLNVKVKQKKPLLKVYNKIGQQFFITTEGSLMPVSDHGSQRVIIANGNILDIYNVSLDLNKQNSDNTDTLLNRSMLFKIWYLTKYINTDPFLKAQIDEIFINQKQDIELVPRVGNQLIVFGDIDNIDIKFKKLNAIYQDVFIKTGWNKYSVINLKYKNQVICTKKIK